MRQERQSNTSGWAQGEADATHRSFRCSLSTGMHLRSSLIGVPGGIRAVPIQLEVAQRSWVFASCRTSKEHWAQFIEECAYL